MFFAHLARACRAKGAQCWRWGLCPGDRLYWTAGAGGYLAFRGPAEAHAAALTQAVTRLGITDLVMLGDSRPAHREAVALARSLPGVTPWIVEQGYLRPDLLLCEPWGMGARSTLPDQFRAADSGAAAIPEAPLRPLPASFLRYAALDVLYHGANLAFAWQGYPHYRPQALDPPVREYGGWILKALRRPARAAGARAAMARLGGHTGPVFLYPLQLETDWQLRRDGTGEVQGQILARVLRSFLDHAPPDALLVVKQHPLDNGLARWDRQTRAAAAGSGRVVFLDGGALGEILARARGVVTVNSTVGLAALAEGVAVHALGAAIYGRVGLTHDGTLDGFWHGAPPPDALRVAAFLRHIRTAHVRGSFDGPGARIGAEAIARRLAGADAAPRDGVAGRGA